DAAPAPGAGEARAEAVLDKARDDTAVLRVLLRSMPKGGDLHNHLSGAIAAEDYLGWAAKDGLCVQREGLALVAPPCPPADTLTAIARDEPFVYARIVDDLSTRGWQRGVGADDVTGHTQFFRSFDRFGMVASKHAADSLAQALRTAAGDHVAYLELMMNPETMTRFIFAAPDVPLDEAGLAARYEVEKSALPALVAQMRAEIDATEAAARAHLGCGTPQAEPACGVALHYLASGFRALPPAQVFRSLIAGFALCAADPRFVGVNIVQPEDWPVALRDYDLHMAMFRFLEAHYPGVHRTLHAGELAYGLVPPLVMKDHIAKAVAAGAERIGHGTDIAYEADAPQTLRTMAQKGIAVEINLSSNAVILGVKGSEHPLNLYRRFGVPVVLSTDDEGVLRTDMTGEYVRAVHEQGLDYRALKQASRNSLEYAFLPGESLWLRGTVGTPVPACAASFAAPACKTLQDRSEKARLEASLEARFARYEETIGEIVPPAP
ncbi:adenosine deaminase, partial [Novosphingobium sp. 1949]